MREIGRNVNLLALHQLFTREGRRADFGRGVTGNEAEEREMAMLDGPPAVTAKDWNQHLRYLVRSSLSTFHRVPSSLIALEYAG